MSTHQVKVFRVGEVHTHPQADNLEYIEVYGGYTCVTQKGLWKTGDLAAFVEPDYVMPDLPEYEWLGPDKCIGAKRLRGIWSQGILVPAPPGSAPGDNVMEALGVTRWVPAQDAQTKGQDQETGVPEDLHYLHTFDVENFRSFSHVLEPGEEVVVTEKIHGCQGRYVFRDGRLWVGSKEEWKRENKNSPWWRTLRFCPWIETWCRNHPEVVVYGEVYGVVQSLRYGAKNDQTWFRVFDVVEGTTHWTQDQVEQEFSPDQRVPVLFRGPFHAPAVEVLIERDSYVCPGQIMEGVVVRPQPDRVHPEVGRVIQKFISPRYLANKNKKSR